ncbi:hypothetical protein GJAV_G00177670 [Gymnothorax javanicus]|nr:hypothetical protein GJAV_G00177670 [Gymnothorax javanicus]
MCLAILTGEQERRHGRYLCGTYGPKESGIQSPAILEKGGVSTGRRSHFIQQS